VTVQGLPFSLVDEIPVLDVYPEFDWRPYPEGLYVTVMEAAEYGLPIYITENGTPEVEGDDAPQILEDHLAYLADAIDEGADVRGYYYWSFIDNYEWNHGMDMKFGLYELNEDKTRSPRPILERYREIMSSNGL
jgi:beta-glucosidase/6-phospho-beta-glucosidase/beta-galactosidase